MHTEVNMDKKGNKSICAQNLKQTQTYARK